MIYFFQVRILALFFFVDILYINYFLGFFFLCVFFTTIIRTHSSESNPANEPVNVSNPD